MVNAMLSNLTTKKFTKKVFYFMMSSILLFSSNNFAQETQGGELPKHDQIQKEYTWNLTDVYPNQEAFEKDFKFVEESIAKFAQYQGKVGQDANTLYSVLKFDEELGIIFGKLSLYAMLSKDLDLSNSTNLALAERVSNLGSKYSAASSFDSPELVAIGEAKLDEFMKAKKELSAYKQTFDN